jgi:FKBP-type peptidyl-prolyl cis-trans isomerase SlpA
VRRDAERASLLTLHYAIGLADCEEPGEQLVSTFGAGPATLVLGAGEFAPGLERCLRDLQPGMRRVFVLEPQEAFGARREDLLRSVPRASFPADALLEEGAAVEFKSPDGGVHPGVVRGVSSAEAGAAVSVDFNHPLAGKRVRFEVELIARNELERSTMSGS